MAQVFEAILQRRSIRKYKSQEVPQDKLKKVLEAATWAPSNGNSQPWRFVVTKGEYVDKVCNIFYEWAKDYIPNAPYIPKEQVPGMLKYAENFGGAPTHIVVTHEIFEDEIKTKEALMAASAAIQNLCLSAWEEGLGTVWIGGHVIYSEETREVLGLTDNEEIVGIIPIGYPDQDLPAPERIDWAQKTKWLGF